MFSFCKRLLLVALTVHQRLHIHISLLWMLFFHKICKTNGPQKLEQAWWLVWGTAKLARHSHLTRRWKISRPSSPSPPKMYSMFQRLTATREDDHQVGVYRATKCSRQDISSVWHLSLKGHLQQQNVYCWRRLLTKTSSSVGVLVMRGGVVCYIQLLNKSPLPHWDVPSQSYLRIVGSHITRTVGVQINYRAHWLDTNTFKKRISWVNNRKRICSLQLSTYQQCA